MGVLDLTNGDLCKKWRVLESGRAAFSLCRLACGKEIFIAEDMRTRLCQHGFAAGQISMWLSHKASSYCRPEGHFCTCLNTDGLRSHSPIEPAIGAPPSYYSILRENMVCETRIFSGGRVAVRMPDSLLPPSSSLESLWMLPSGQVRCPHGNSSTTLRTHSQHRAVGALAAGFIGKRPCNCLPGPMRRRRFGHKISSKRAVDIHA